MCVLFRVIVGAVCFFCDVVMYGLISVLCLFVSAPCVKVCVVFD